MKRGTPRHPKTKRLARELNLPISQAVGILEMLWHFTADFCPRGDIGRMDDESILESFGESPEKSGMLQKLIDCGWIDLSEEFRLVVHDWHEHCDDYTKKKLKKQGVRFASLRVQNFPDDSGKFTATLPRPTTALPNLTQPYPTTTTTEPEGGGGGFVSHSPNIQTLYSVEWPLTFEAVCGRFPADVVLVGKIIQASMQAFMSVDLPKIPAPDDPMLADAVALAAKQSAKQISAGLFLKNVPTVITSWAKFGRTAAPDSEEYDFRKAIRKA